MDRMTIDIETVDWSYGYYGNFDILLSEDTILTVDWGDGKCEKLSVRDGQWLRLSHSYPIKDYRMELPYRICIESERGYVVGFSEALTEFSVKRLDVSACPRLSMLRVSSCDLCALDLSGNKKLKILEIENFSGTELNLSNNPDLEYLDCRNSKIQTLDIRKCERLVYLNCAFCTDLQKISMGNRSNLHDVCLDGVNLMEKSALFLCRKVHENGGNVVYDMMDFGIGMYYFPLGSAVLP